MTSSKVIPPKNAARYMAGEYICREGAKTETELLAAINFDRRPDYARNNLRSAIEGGWLKQSSDGLIDISDRAREHYNSVPAAQPESPKGQVVPPRFVDLLYGPELSRKYIPNRRGPRIDALDNSLAAMPSHFGKVAV